VLQTPNITTVQAKLFKSMVNPNSLPVQERAKPRQQLVNNSIWAWSAGCHKPTNQAYAHARSTNSMMCLIQKHHEQRSVVVLLISKYKSYTF